MMGIVSACGGGNLPAKAVVATAAAAIIIDSAIRRWGFWAGSSRGNIPDGFCL
jgi:hypothetical protein